MTLFRIFRLTFYALFLLAVGIAYYVYIQALSKPIENRDLQITIPSGVGVSWLANHLQQQGVIESKYVFRAYTWLNRPEISIKAGQYNLLDTESIPDLVDKFEAGRVVQYALTLIEGKTFKEYLSLVKSQNRLVDQLEGVSDDQIMREVGLLGRHPEGQFAPQTYFYQDGASDLEILKQASIRQQEILDAAWAERADDVQLKTPYELLILASIIEKETGVASERPLISGVFNNRLKIGMKLQTDPTVIYGMGDAYKGNIRRRDLTTDTEYNTYTRYGLPPTPIAMPGEAAIFAAANPETTKALYFVGKGDGSHAFSETLQQHNNAVIKYQLGGKPRSKSQSSSGAGR